MDEVQEVLQAAAEMDRAGRSWAVATIVAVAGSTYRRPGARLLVRDDNSWVGNLSGGCLEGEVLGLGAEAIDDGKLRRHVFDLTADEEAIWGWGLGCNGAMEVIVEAGATTGRRHLELLDQGRRSGRPFRLITVIGPEGHHEVGAHVLLFDEADAMTAVVADRDDAGPATLDLASLTVSTEIPDGASQTPPDGAPDDASGDVVAAALDQLRTTVVQVDGRDVFVEHVTGTQRLVVCGAGHDAVPLVARAASLGWEVVVVDDRPSFLTTTRFPKAAELVRSAPRDAADATRMDARTAAVVMSHNFMRDADYLAALAPVGLAYLGMLGPSQRLKRLVDHLATEDIVISDAQLEPVHGPAGLDLGAEGPDEIAVAIIAEVMAVARGRGAGSLRTRSGPIHQPPTHAPPGIDTSTLPVSWRPDADGHRSTPAGGGSDAGAKRQDDH